MSDSHTEYFLLEAGKSTFLDQIFHSIADQDFGGVSRFREKECKELGKVISCRIYAKPLLELVHMIRFAALMDRRARFENLFWEVIPATPANFRDLICAKDLSGIEGLEVSPVEIQLSYPDGEGFAIRYGRMPFLAVLMDFLVNAIGFTEVSDLVQKVTLPGCKKADISTASSELAKKVYRFLEEHLTSVQNQKKFKQILSFLEDRYGSSFSDELIDDDCLMAFWQEFSHLKGEESGNFTAFTTVFDSFVRFVQSLDHGKTLSSANHAASIGNDREMGEVDPDAAHLLGDFMMDEAMDPIHQLAEPPMDAVKFLNKRETETLSYILPRQREIDRWRISYLRGEVFGKGQARISQALRNKVLADEFQALINNPVTENYQDRLAGLAKVKSYLDKLILATLYVVSVRDGRDDDSGATTIDFEILGKARKAFHSISRQGFQEENLNNPETIEAFEGAAECLTPVISDFGVIQETLVAAHDWDDMYESDQPVFSDQFRRIYGESQ